MSAAAAALVLFTPLAQAAGWASSDDLLRQSASAAVAFRASADKVTGLVEICTAADNCRPAFDGRPLREGDILKTGADGRCDVVVEGAGRLRVLQETELKVGGEKKCSFKLAKGSVLSALEAADCEVSSPQAAAATRDTRLRIAYEEKGVTQFAVAGSSAKLTARAKPRTLFSRWWAGKAPTRAKVPEAAAGALARVSGVATRSGEPVEEGASIKSGDTLTTEDGGWASVALSDGFAAVLGAGSRVAFTKASEGRLGLALEKGRLYVARLRPGTTPPPLVTVGRSRAVSGSDEFEIGVDEHSGLADFAVYSGVLSIENDRKTAQ